MSKTNKAGKQKIEIVEMDRFFLYLPVHYACARGFFGYVPPQYDIVIRESRDRTDESAYKELTNRIDANKNVYFALCDPTFVLKSGLCSAGVAPAILAGIITNAAFWAVNHRSQITKGFRDLGSFDKIIAYKQGTTSYRIAHRIFRDSKKADPNTFIETVSVVGDELALLRKSSRRTLALSPAILEIDALLGTMSAGDDYDIELALGTTPEYNNVLVTGLLSRQDVVAAHPELVSGMLKAIQHAMILVRYFDQDVIQFATDYYSGFGYRAPGALERATDAHVFPSTVEVSQAHWENAVRAAMDAEEQPASSAIDDQIRNSFEHYIKPYQSYAKAAARDEMLGTPKNIQSHAARLPKRFAFAWLLGGIGFGALLSLAGVFIHWIAAAVAGSEVVCALVLFASFNLASHKVMRVLHVALWCIILLLSLLLSYLWLVSPGTFQPYMSAIIGGIPTVFASNMTLLYNVYKKDKEAADKQ